MRANPQVKKLKVISEQQKQRPNVDIVFTIWCRKNNLSKKFNKSIKISKSVFLIQLVNLEVMNRRWIIFLLVKENSKKELKMTNFMNIKIFDNYYGRSKKNIDDLRKKNYDILFDIDWQGNTQLSKYKELNLIKVFILPPNLKSLEERLKLRNQDDKASVKKRLNSYKSDRKYWYNYDHILINDNLDNCFRQLEKIIEDNKAQLSL